MAILYRFLLFIMCRRFDFRIKPVACGYDVRHATLDEVSFKVRFKYTANTRENIGQLEVNGRNTMTEQDVLSILRGDLISEWSDFSQNVCGGLSFMTSRDFDSTCRLLGIEEGQTWTK